MHQNTHAEEKQPLTFMPSDEELENLEFSMSPLEVQKTQLTPINNNSQQQED